MNFVYEFASGEFFRVNYELLVLRKSGLFDKQRRNELFFSVR